jgi:hypothetical protein
MPRRVFYSFHYEVDCHRAARIRNMGVVEGNTPATGNGWETITRGGDKRIQRWIDAQLYGKSCTVVLIGEETANRKWINYEIEASWNAGKGLVGIHIHKLKNLQREISRKGRNPFDSFNIGGSSKRLSSIVPVYNPPYTDSKDVYAHIKENLADWIEEAIEIRADY